MPVEVFQTRLLEWWRAEGRVLPWREKIRLQVIGDRFEEENKRGTREIKTVQGLVELELVVREKAFSDYFAGELRRDPYRVIVSEVMLQQTQVDRVIPKFEAWMEQWPTIQDLARASLSEVLVAWQGLGYNRRARFLWLLAKEIVEKRQGVWPETEAELIKLPGIGKYTARALLSFAFGQPVAVVDVNVKRVLGRWFYLNSKFQNLQQVQVKIPNSNARELVMTEKNWFRLADSILPVQADPWNQAIMDFGALICTAKNPKCEECPMFAVCEVNQLAISHGFTSYRQMLLEENFENPGKGKSNKGNKDFGLKFEQTDRFFRGRIIDALRKESLTKQDLLIILKTKFNFDDEARFDELLRELIKEGLVSTNSDRLQLG